MGKNKKRKSSLGSTDSSIDTTSPSVSASTVGQEKDSVFDNPLYKQQKAFLSTLTRQERDYYFSSHSPSSIDPDRRAEIWMQQANTGEELVNHYAWATPSEDCIKIFNEFAPLVEVGCGSNAYWAKYMKHTAGIDVLAFDRNIHLGGKISSEGKEEKKRKKKKSRDDGTNNGSGKDVKDSSNLVVQEGGPEVLLRPELKSRTLFLCYPDEEDEEDVEETTDSEGQPPLSFGWQCLNAYKGMYVIHVGELAFLDSSLNLDQAPWGRSSSPEFQQRLASEFHCIAKIQLPNWLHVRDSISVWKRSELCEMCFVGVDEDDDEEIVEYRHIPPEEMLPSVMVAPCMAHLLQPSIAGPTLTNKKSSNYGVAGDQFSPKKASTNSTEKIEKNGNNEVNLKKTKKKKSKGKQKQVPTKQKNIIPDESSPFGNFFKTHQKS
jgi:hypothetical protein